MDPITVASTAVAVGSTLFGFAAGEQSKKNAKKAARIQSTRAQAQFTSNVVGKIKEARALQARVTAQGVARGVGQETSGLQAQAANIRTATTFSFLRGEIDALAAKRVAANLDSAQINLATQQNLFGVASLALSFGQTFGGRSPTPQEPTPTGGDTTKAMQGPGLDLFGP